MTSPGRCFFMLGLAQFIQAQQIGSTLPSRAQLHVAIVGISHVLPLSAVLVGYKERVGMAGGLSSLKFGFARCRKWNESVRYLRPNASPTFAAMQRSAWLSAGVGERFTMTKCLPAK